MMFAKANHASPEDSHLFRQTIFIDFAKANHAIATLPTPKPLETQGGKVCHEAIPPLPIAFDISLVRINEPGVGHKN